MSLLACLCLSDCTPVFHFETQTWDFPCGLSVADGVAFTPIPGGHRLAAVHWNHHDKKHPVGPWNVLVQEELAGPHHTTDEDSGIRIVFYCSCEGRDEARAG